MTDEELRALVRDAVSRHLQAGEQSPRPPHGDRGPRADWDGHPSHHQYVTIVNADEACVIEPSVACNHCGYCRSHGH